MDRILIVDSDPELLRRVGSLLQSSGFRVTTATDGEQALEKMQMSGEPCVVLVEVSLPGRVDGYEVCRLIRSRSERPMIILTGHIREDDRILGAEAGADAFLAKPFGSRELLARVKALRRRSGVRLVQVGDLTIDLERRRVTSGAEEILLTPTEYSLLSELARNAGKIMSHEELLTRVWGPAYRDETEYLRAYIKNLRKKVEPNPEQPRHILSRRGMGYYLAVE